VKIVRDRVVITPSAKHNLLLSDLLSNILMSEFDLLPQGMLNLLVSDLFPQGMFFLVFYLLLNEEVRNIFKVKAKKKTLTAHGFDDVDDQSLDSQPSSQLIEKVCRNIPQQVACNCLITSPEQLIVMCHKLFDKGLTVYQL